MASGYRCVAQRKTKKPGPKRKRVPSYLRSAKNTSSRRKCR